MKKNQTKIRTKYKSFAVVPNYKSLFHLVFFFRKYELLKISFTVMTKLLPTYYNMLVSEAISSQN